MLHFPKLSYLFPQNYDPLAHIITKNQGLDLNLAQIFFLQNRGYGFLLPNSPPQSEGQTQIGGRMKDKEGGRPNGHLSFMAASLPRSKNIATCSPLVVKQQPTRRGRRLGRWRRLEEGDARCESDSEMRAMRFLESNRGNIVGHFKIIERRKRGLGT